MSHLPVLALDIATHCGWAMRYVDGTLGSGVWHLDTKCRELELDRQLVSRPRPLTMVIEMPIIYGHAGKRGRDSLVVFPLIGVARRYAQMCAMQYAEIAPSTLKKHMTGNGRASKDEVRSAVSVRLGLPVTDKDQADALAVLFTWEDNHG